MGEGIVVSGEMPDEQAERINEKLDSQDMLAVNTLGQLAKHPRISALRRFITGWYLSYLTADNTRGTPDSGPQERLSESGDNLPNVIQYLKESHEEVLDSILDRLSQRIPRLEKVLPEVLQDNRLLLQIKDAPFEKPILSKFASDGTLKMLAYLTLLYDPNPPMLIGIEEPENQLHPRLLYDLAEECRAAANNSQVMITTHSPFFVNALSPKEVWVFSRNIDGYTEATRCSEMPGINEFVKNGNQLGNLWFEGHFNSGNLSF
jgi:predicted ATPase